MANVKTMCAVPGFAACRPYTSSYHQPRSQMFSRTGPIANLFSLATQSDTRDKEQKGLQATIATLQEEIEKLKSGNLEMAGRLEVAAASREEFSSRISSLIETNATQQHDIKSLRAELPEAKEKYNQLVADSNAERTPLQIRVLYLETQHRELKEIVVGQEMMISELERQDIDSSRSFPWIERGATQRILTMLRGGSRRGGRQAGGRFTVESGEYDESNKVHVAPLKISSNRWTRRLPDDEEQNIERKVKALLNKLTMKNFDPISDQIIEWANKPEAEKDGRTLIHIIRLIFEQATEGSWPEIYAQLCRKMMETISPNVQDDGIRSADGKPITGGQLFRKHLLNRCQDDFERGWTAKVSEDAVETSGEVELYSNEYYAARKAKRQGLGLAQFIGELYKLQMLTERVIHKCVQKLLNNVDNPEEEEIESLCRLLTTVGRLLDNPKARAHMDIYFTRMKGLGKSSNVVPRIRFMLQDLIELRERKWIPRNGVAAPTAIAQVHEEAAKRRARAEKEAGNLDNWLEPGRLISRSRPIEGENKVNGGSADRSEDQGSGDVPPAMSEAEANKKVAEDVDEFLSLRNIHGCERYFTGLPSEHHHRLVAKMVSKAIESKESDGKLVADAFARAVEKDLCSISAFEEGFLPTAELLDDIAIDSPKAFQIMATMMKGAGFGEDE